MAINFNSALSFLKSEFTQCVNNFQSFSKERQLATAGKTAGVAATAGLLVGGLLPITLAAAVSFYIMTRHVSALDRIGDFFSNGIDALKGACGK